MNLRGIPAAYRAAREPGDEAEDFSSSARHMGQPLSGARGGNAANESKDGDDCSGVDDNVFGAGEGLMRSGRQISSFEHQAGVQGGDA